VADIKKSKGKSSLVVGIILTLAGGFGMAVSRIFYTVVVQINFFIVSSVILVIGISILVVGIVLRILARRKG